MEYEEQISVDSEKIKNYEGEMKRLQGLLVEQTHKN